MKEVSKSLASVAEVFTTALCEATYQTQSGKELIDKYRSYTMANEVTCSVVNNFISEAKNCKYDNGVITVLENITNAINLSLYSWMLESACERLENDNTTFGFLNRNAVTKVRPLLNESEQELIQKVKAGALKDVMYCESFSNIIKQIFKANPVVESTQEFTVVHPISIVEKKDDTVYFVAASKVWKMTTESLEEASAKEVSNDFIQIAQLLESNQVSYTVADGGTIKYSTHNFDININEEGKCTKSTDKNIQEFTVDQLREHNALYVQALPISARKNTEYVLEALAKCCENFDNVSILNNVGIYTTKNDQFIVIENNGQAIAQLLKSNHAQMWSINENIFEAVKFIKQQTKLDLTEVYKEKIDTVVESEEEKEAETIKENMKQDAIQQRKQKIDELTQRFKDDPLKLAVLSKVAQDLNEL